GQEVAPEVGDGAVLPLLIAGKEPHCPGPQGVDEQTINPAGPHGEELLPGPAIALQAGTAEKPIHWIEAIEVRLPARAVGVFASIARPGAVQVEGALQGPRQG